eukprot:m.14134 g.14134  ORF g.14134 m.14134 type:complete len:296 (-) comp10013_c0_seq1:146-1033(-)
MGKRSNKSGNTPQYKPASATTLLMAGTTSGMLITTMLNPYDRALYLSVIDRRSFLDPANWKVPFKGWRQTIVSRTLSSALYFPLEHQSLVVAQKLDGLSYDTQLLLSGQIAGLINGLVLSPLAIIKYQTWGHPDDNRSFSRMARRMYLNGGMGAFTRGMRATIARDVIFGCSFTWGRKRLHDEHLMVGTYRLPEFVPDFIAAGCATILSAPFNFVRNVQFAKSTSVPRLTQRLALTELISETRASESPLRCVLTRLRIGWGTTRVAAGMALTAGVFRTMLDVMEPHSDSDDGVSL